MSQVPLASALLLLGLLGLFDAAYFALVAYRRIPPDSRWVPAFCRMDDATCARIVDTPYGRLGGVPNGVTGLAWYGAVVAAAVAWLVTGTLPACGWLVALAAASVAVSVFLLWALLARLHVHCLLCYAAHGINLAVLLLVGGACVGF